jgi:hypothetical protein
MLRDVEVDDAATIVRHDDEDIKDSQANCCDREEINGHQLSDMIPKKRHPGLCGLPVLRNQSRNRPFGNLKPKLQQFSMDARRSPDGIGGNHRSDQLVYLQTQSRASWPSRLGQSPPEPFESPSLPSDHRLRLNEGERSSPILPEFLQRNPK